MLLIVGLDRDNQVLSESYKELVRKYRSMEAVPTSVLERHGAIPSDHPVLAEITGLLARAKMDHMSQEQLVNELQELRIKLRTVEQEFMGRARSLARPDASKNKLLGEAEVAR
jgi:hypothetical protein